MRSREAGSLVCGKPRTQEHLRVFQMDSVPQLYHILRYEPGAYGSVCLVHTDTVRPGSHPHAVPRPRYGPSLGLSSTATTRFHWVGEPKSEWLAIMYYHPSTRDLYNMLSCGYNGLNRTCATVLWPLGTWPRSVPFSVDQSVGRCWDRSAVVIDVHRARAKPQRKQRDAYLQIYSEGKLHPRWRTLRITANQ